MKTPLRFALLIPGLCAAVVAQAAPNTPVNVVVSNSRDGAVVFKGKTDGSGKFATGALPGGSYVVQFTAANAALKGKQLSMAAVGGKRAVTATAVPGEKFAGAGVAMKVDVAKNSPLTGTVGSDAAIAAATAPASSSAEPVEAVRANVKVIKGKRYVWVPGPIGSNMGGRWVEEGSEAAVLSTSNKKGNDGEFLRKLQSSDSGPATLNGRGHQGPGNNNSGL